MQAKIKTFSFYLLTFSQGTSTACAPNIFTFSLLWFQVGQAFQDTFCNSFVAFYTAQIWCVVCRDLLSISFCPSCCISNKLLHNCKSYCATLQGLFPQKKFKKKKIKAECFDVTLIILFKLIVRGGLFVRTQVVFDILRIQICTRGCQSWQIVRLECCALTHS